MSKKKDKHRSKTRGKYTVADREKAITYMLNNLDKDEVTGELRPNFLKCERELGISDATLNRWWSSKKDDEEFEQIREQYKKDFVNEAWKGIRMSQELMNKRVQRALEREKELDNLMLEILQNTGRGKEYTKEESKELISTLKVIKAENAQHVVNYMGVSMDKLRLLQGEPTSINQLQSTVQDGEVKELLKEALEIEDSNVVELKKAK